MTYDFDIIINGGGLAGASLAASLRHTALKIAVLDQHPWATATTEITNYDERVLALNYVSKQILQGMGAWTSVEKLSAPIQQIHVSEQGGFGFTRLNAQLLQLPALGYVISANHLLQAIQAVVTPSTAPNITIFTPAELTQVKVTHQVAVTFLKNGETHELHAPLLVAADGGNSTVRQLLNIGCDEHDYGQTALIANVTMAQPHHNVAYERFGGAGTIALLPLQNQDYSLVWSIKSAQRDELMQLSDQAFLARLQRHFGWRAGQFLKIGTRAAHPLRLLQIQQLVQPHIAFVGNAAHTLHPVAGQGFNLGLRDVATLAEILSQTPVQNFGDEDTLQRYVQQQCKDQQRVITITDSLVKTFATDLLPLRWLRNLSLLTLDAVPPLKRLFVRQMTGLTAAPSRLSSGLPIKVQE